MQRGAVVDRAVAAAADRGARRWERAELLAVVMLLSWRHKWPVRTGQFPARLTGHFDDHAARHPGPHRARARSASSSPARSATWCSPAPWRRGDRLPSSRALAADLGVSPLGGRAGLRPAARRGLARGAPRLRHVRRVAAAWRPSRRPTPRAGPRAPAASSASTPARRGSTRGTPPGGDGPGATCRRPRRRAGTTTRAACPSCATRSPSDLAPHPRPALSTRTRSCVTGGTTDGLRHLLGVLPPGPVAIEDPGYRAAVETVRAAGRDVHDHPALDAGHRPDRAGARPT